MHVLVEDGADTQPLQRRVFEMLRDDFDVYFSTVQVETECLEREEARAIDATWAVPDTGPDEAARQGSGPVILGPDRASSNGLYDSSR
jgi:cobalt-zinc-cadmium efflux system protein